MTTTYPDSALASHSFGFMELMTALLEPALLTGAAFFWVATLPFVALSLVFVKIWDALRSFCAERWSRAV